MGSEIGMNVYEVAIIGFSYRTVHPALYWRRFSWPLSVQARELGFRPTIKIVSAEKV